MLRRDNILDVYCQCEIFIGKILVFLICFAENRQIIVVSVSGIAQNITFSQGVAVYLGHLKEHDQLQRCHELEIQKQIQIQI